MPQVNKQTKILIFFSNSENSEQTTISTYLKKKKLQIDLIEFPSPIEYGYKQKLATKVALDFNYDYILFIQDSKIAKEKVEEIAFDILSNTVGLKIGLREKENRTNFFLKPLLKYFEFLKKAILKTEYVSSFYYLAFSRKVLASVPFELNQNNFLFLWELLLQTIHIKAPILRKKETVEKESLSFAQEKEIFTTILHYKFHELGMFCLLKYQNIQPLLYRDKTFVEYSSHKLAINKIISLKPKKLLDIGCGPGFVGKRCEENGIRVTGIDQNKPLDGMISEFHKADFDQNSLPVDLNQYDIILMLDIIEHLSSPEAFLLMMKNSLDFKNGNSPKLLLSTPNIAFFSIRINLLLGRFNYAERGILDITHKRLFTKNSLIQSLKDCGYEIEEIIPVGAPFGAVMQNSIGKFLGSFANLLARILPSVFAFQFMILSKPTPGLKSILANNPVKVKRKNG
jgi:2-polyprenyl-3-methyl-5-hydroxy-6-metoxy-1,4-benzoquinol methylase